MRQIGKERERVTSMPIDSGERIEMEKIFLRARDMKGDRERERVCALKYKIFLRKVFDMWQSENQKQIRSKSER